MSYVTEAAKSLSQAIKSQSEYRIINYGGRAVYVEGFLRVSLLSSQKIQFLLKKSSLTVVGENLSLSKLVSGTALVEGEIGGVYEER